MTIWLNRDDKVSSWKIEIRDQYLSWTPSNGVETGDRIGSGKNLEKPWEADKLEKYSNLPRIEELARDILMAAPISYKEQLLESFAGIKEMGFRFIPEKEQQKRLASLDEKKDAMLKAELAKWANMVKITASNNSWRPDVTMCEKRLADLQSGEMPPKSRKQLSLKN